MTWSRLRPGVHAHFIGIGGIGMSGLAKMLLESGLTVSGSDIQENALTRQLVQAGATIAIGHKAATIAELPEQSVIVTSTAIHAGNPELDEAVRRSLPILHRSHVLKAIFHGEYLGHKETIGITGTHGKTTLTGMMARVLQQANLEPTIVAGGKIPELGTNAVLGTAQRVAVAELDESDGSIVQYWPTMTIVSNIEMDHADHYPGGVTQILDTFARFLSALQSGSRVLINLDCANSRSLLRQMPQHVQPVTIRLGDDASLQADFHLADIRPAAKGKFTGTLYSGQTRLGELTPGVPGLHNLWNSAMVAVIAHLLDVDFAVTREALATFGGMGRRFEHVGTANGIYLVDDYAHHPTEVSVTLAAAKGFLEKTRPDGANGHLYAIFQPHRYSRLDALWNDFVKVFQSTKPEQVSAYLVDVYPAGEQPIPGVSAQDFCKEVHRPNVKYLPGASMAELNENLKQQVAAKLQPGDMVLSMGAGSITQLLRQWETES